MKKGGVFFANSTCYHIELYCVLKNRAWFNAYPISKNKALLNPFKRANFYNLYFYCTLENLTYI